jgi:hypothetical protein
MGIDTQSHWFQTFVAEVAHFGAAYGVVFTLLIKAHSAAVPTSLGILVAAGLKEFWYDANYETPKQSFGANLLDFTCYAAGVLTAFVMYTHG